MEITHEIDRETGRMIQIVPAWYLRQILLETGDGLDRPADFDDDDEWFVGE